MNIEVVAITMVSIVVVIPLEEKKKVSPRSFFYFVSLLGFILGDRFFKLGVERGNMQRWEKNNGWSRVNANKGTIYNKEFFFVFYKIWRLNL